MKIRAYMDRIMPQSMPYDDNIPGEEEESAERVPSEEMADDDDIPSDEQERDDEYPPGEITEGNVASSEAQEFDDLIPLENNSRRWDSAVWWSRMRWLNYGTYNARHPLHAVWGRRRVEQRTSPKHQIFCFEMCLFEETGGFRWIKKINYEVSISVGLMAY